MDGHAARCGTAGKGCVVPGCLSWRSQQCRRFRQILGGWSAALAAPPKTESGAFACCPQLLPPGPFAVTSIRWGVAWCRCKRELGFGVFTCRKWAGARQIRASCKEGKNNFNWLQHMLSKDRDQEQKLL